MVQILLNFFGTLFSKGYNLFYEINGGCSKFFRRSPAGRDKYYRPEGG